MRNVFIGLDITRERRHGNPFTFSGYYFDSYVIALFKDLEKYVKEYNKIQMQKQGMSYCGQLSLNLEDVSKLVNNREYIPKDSLINIKLCNKSCEVEPPDKLDKKKKNSVVFDDVVDENI